MSQQVKTNQTTTLSISSKSKQQKTLKNIPKKHYFALPQDYLSREFHLGQIQNTKVQFQALNSKRKISLDAKLSDLQISQSGISNETLKKYPTFHTMETMKQSSSQNVYEIKSGLNQPVFELLCQLKIKIDTVALKLEQLGANRKVLIQQSTQTHSQEIPHENNHDPICKQDIKATHTQILQKHEQKKQRNTKQTNQNQSSKHKKFKLFIFFIESLWRKRTKLQKIIFSIFYFIMVYYGLKYHFLRKKNY